MRILKKTKSLWQVGRTSNSEVPAPLPPLNTVDAPPLPSIEQHTHRQFLQRTPEPAQLVTAENIRELRERIRYRYSLDVEILKQRNVKKYMRGNLEENMRKSVAALADIQKMVEGWDRREFFATELEYRKFQDIRQRLLTGTKIDWEKNKPWDLAVSNMVPLRAPYEMSNRTDPIAQRPGPSSFGVRQAVRERPEDVPFARQSQMQNHRSSREPVQNPPRQTQHFANTPQQIQHSMDSLRQEHDGTQASRQVPYFANPTPQMRHAADSVRQSQFVEGLLQQNVYALASPQQSEISLHSSHRSELGVRSPPPSELAPGSPPPIRYAAYTPSDAHGAQRSQSFMPNTQPAAPYGDLPHPQQGGTAVATHRQTGVLRPSRQRDVRKVSAPTPQIKLTAPTPPVGRRVLSDPSHVDNTKYRPIRMDSPIPKGRVEGPPSSQHSSPGY
ncbi:uncharacterized protein ALTATR162_LOCUS2154 [Alternaria atra]|uniref:Uncharacterized protein n=1 Tax=Alternaria atra TaxID=119953 RepID=A0A8J2HXK8_9PLEO|nr:uncharacterized protein ALTATR162_LOCUS2154 [Alternaria atra]CAG5148127.1 unnamed protein product [Alternaria atra]